MGSLEVIDGRTEYRKFAGLGCLVVRCPSWNGLGWVTGGNKCNEVGSLRREGSLDFADSVHYSGSEWLYVSIICEFSVGDIENGKVQCCTGTVSVIAGCCFTHLS